MAEAFLSLLVSFRPCDPSNLVSLCPFYMRLPPEMHQLTCSHGSCSASCFAMDTMKGRISVKHLVLVLVSAPQAPPGFQRPPLTRTMTSVIGGVGATGDGACFCWALLDSGKNPKKTKIQKFNPFTHLHLKQNEIKNKI